ncbi:MAG: phenylacetate--CoA ligase [Erysipelotrichaceae bacterium]|nr:phenylacetate--CoA ligase [Erysipelotrichaceae bacterium]
MNKSRLDDLIMKQEGLNKLDRNILEEIQLNKLNALLRKENLRQGFYAHLPSSLASLNELSSLPFTTADDLRKHFPRLFLGSSSEVEKVLTEQTSGTTGEAKRIFYAKEDLAHTVSFFAAGIGEMVREGEKVMIGMPYTGPNSLADLIAQAVSECGGIPVQLHNGSLYEQCCQYHDVQPECAIDLPVPLLARARYYDSLYGKNSFPLRKALLSADACADAVEKAMINEFRLVLFPHYGTREMCFGGAITCEAHEGMHLREHQIIGEIVDESGQTVPNGEWGELVITTVDMKVLPLIRFRTGDRARFLKEPCPCGSVTRRLDRIRRLGHDAEILENIEDLFFALPEVIDLSVSETEGRYHIGFLVTAGADTERIRKMCGEKDFTCETRIIAGTDKPLYSGKRVIQHHSDMV